MATKWIHPQFIRSLKTNLDAADAALPTSAEVSVTYCTSAYANVTFTKSA